MLGSGLQARICDVGSGRALPESPSPGDSDKTPPALRVLCGDSVVATHLLRRGAVHPSAATGLILFFRRWKPSGSGAPTATAAAQPTLPLVTEEPSASMPGSSTDVFAMASNKEIWIRFAINGEMRTLKTCTSSTDVLPVWTVPDAAEEVRGEASNGREATKVPRDVGRINLPATETIESVTIALWSVMEGLGFPDPRQAPPTAAFHFDFIKEDPTAAHRAAPQQDLAVSSNQIDPNTIKPGAALMLAAKSMARRYSMGDSNRSSVSDFAGRPVSSTSSYGGGEMPLHDNKAFKTWLLREAAGDVAAKENGKKGFFKSWGKAGSPAAAASAGAGISNNSYGHKTAKPTSTLRGRFNKMIGSRDMSINTRTAGVASPQISSPISPPLAGKSFRRTPRNAPTPGQQSGHSTPLTQNGADTPRSESALAQHNDGRYPPAHTAVAAHVTAPQPSFSQVMADAGAAGMSVSNSMTQEEMPTRRGASAHQAEAGQQQQQQGEPHSHDSHVTAPEEHTQPLVTRSTAAATAPALTAGGVDSKPRPYSVIVSGADGRQSRMRHHSKQLSHGGGGKKRHSVSSAQPTVPDAPLRRSSIGAAALPLTSDSLYSSASGTSASPGKVLESLSEIKTLRTKHADLDAERRELEAAIRADLLNQLQRERSAWMEKVQAKEDEVRELRAFLERRMVGGREEEMGEEEGEEEEEEEEAAHGEHAAVAAVGGKQIRRNGSGSEYADARDGAGGAVVETPTTANTTAAVEG